MSYTPPPEQTDRLVRVVLGLIVADHYARENDPHADAHLEHMAEEVARAACDLTDAVNALDPDRQPIGWHKVGEPEPAEPAISAERLAKIEAHAVATQDWATQSFAPEHAILLAHVDVPDLIAALRRQSTPAPAAPTTWTGPDGTVYDLGHGLRDAEGDVWVCLGWWHPFDGNPVPLMECDNDRTDLATVVAQYGPLTKRADD